VAGRIFAGNKARPPVVLAIGKAAGAMADAARRVLGPTPGLAIVREGSPRPLGAIPVLEGGHPIPDERSEQAARAAQRFLRAHSDAPALFLLSGGGSAIFEAPVPEIPLRDLARTTSLLLGSGAPIQAMNAVRRHLSDVKGGRLLRGRAAPSVTLALSDVVGDTPWDIASGPTVADPTTFTDAVRAARRYGVWSQLPAPVRRHLGRGVRGEVEETIKPGDPVLDRTRFALIGSNRTALAGAAVEARRRGYRTHVMARPLTGESAAVGRTLASIARRAKSPTAPGPGGRCWLSGGETTVHLGPHPGRGGRNQELVLAAATPLQGLDPVGLLSVGTDGIDGPTDAAGGWVDGGTSRRAEALGIDLGRALRHHESYDTLRRLGGLWITGPTGTNVMDLHVLLVGSPGGRPGRISRGRGSSSPRRGVRSNRRTPS
jgi:hydroxypyruvate reductase